MQIIFPDKDPKTGLYPKSINQIPTSGGQQSGYFIIGIVQDSGRKYCCFHPLILDDSPPKIFVEEVATMKASFFCFEDLRKVDDATYKEVTSHLQNIGILGL